MSVFNSYMKYVCTRARVSVIKSNINIRTLVYINCHQTLSGQKARIDVVILSRSILQIHRHSADGDYIQIGRSAKQR